MALYEADLFENATPVGKPKGGIRKPKGRKAIAVEAAEDDVVVEVAPPAIVKKKRQMSDKQKEALAAGRERKKAAIVAKEAEISAAQKEIEEKEKALVAKKAATAEKRRLAREAKKNDTPESITESAADTVSLETEMAVVKVAAKRKRKSEQPVVSPADGGVAPKWFLEYVNGVKQEENVLSVPKKTKKAVREESVEVAAEQWAQPMVRDRLREEQDRHMSSTYQMIFGRRMK